MKTLFLTVRIPDISQTQSTFSVLHCPMLCHAIKNYKTIYLAVMLLLRPDFTVVASEELDTYFPLLLI